MNTGTTAALSAVRVTLLAGVSAAALSLSFGNAYAQNANCLNGLSGTSGNFVSGIGNSACGVATGNFVAGIGNSATGTGSGNFVAGIGQHANQTGNYSVLRDLGTPVFRERFDQAQLTAVFSNLRSRGVSLMPVLFLAPNLTKQAEMTEGRQLHLVGDFPTQPLKIQYEMLFLQIDGVWRIDGFAVDAVPVQASANTTAPGAAPVPPSGVPPVGQSQPAKPAANDTKSEKKVQTTKQ